VTPPSDWGRRAAGAIAGGSSTGSKRPASLYGDDREVRELPTHYQRASGCRIVTGDGRELLDCTMSLGAVALGYADPLVTESVERAIRDGNVCGLAPTLEVEIAERLCELIPCAERVRFLKTGAEGVAAAVRIARAHTGRSRVLGCGYFGWLDWSSDAAGVPPGVQSDFRALPFDDIPALEAAMEEMGEDLAALVLEPVIEREPDPDWLRLARELCDRSGAALVLDEVKTGFRMSSGGYQQRVGITPDLAVFGKAMANGFPLAAVVGRARVMAALSGTWVSSTLASETTALAAATPVLDRHASEDVCGTLAAHGAAMRKGIERAIARSNAHDVHTAGVSEMWLVRFGSESRAGEFVRRALDEGVLFKRGAYNFASLVHRTPEVEVIEHAAYSVLSRLSEERT
jgi:glutamate-1-semialdehyde 2,1-aminomutase